MPGRARILAAGFPVHVILRGINRSAVFFSEDDHRFFLGCLGEAAREDSVAVHTYVLMTDDVHVLMTAEPEQGVSAVMKRLRRRYVQYVNRTYRRTGGLFEGRFRSSLIEANRYLLACQRYIELNPMRAAMVDAPADYPWSSYRANALDHTDPIITPHPLYLDLVPCAEVPPPPIAGCSKIGSARRRCSGCASAPMAAFCSAAISSSGKSRQWSADVPGKARQGDRVRKRPTPPSSRFRFRKCRPSRFSVQYPETG